MKTEMSRHPEFMLGFAKVSEVVASTIFTMFVLGFYLAHQLWATGFFTSSFTPALATLFYASILYNIVNVASKACTPRKDEIALVELIGTILFATVAGWVYSVFPFNFAHVADVVPATAQFMFTWLTNDIGRILVALVFVASIIAVLVTAVKLVWRLFERPIFQWHETEY